MVTKVSLMKSEVKDGKRVYKETYSAGFISAAQKLMTGRMKEIETSDKMEENSRTSNADRICCVFGRIIDFH